MLAENDGVMDGENVEENTGFQNIMQAKNDDVMDGENAAANADFDTASEFMEGITEREEISTDHTPSNNGQETLNADQFDKKMRRRTP